MTLSLFTIPDHPAFDLTRGASATLGGVLLVACAVAVIRLSRRVSVVPSWVRLALIGWMIGDAYVASREFFEIGRPVFVFGLPLAIAWECYALAYLRRLWRATGGLRQRPDGW